MGASRRLGLKRQCAHRKTRQLPMPAWFEALECRVLLSASFDITGLTQLRNTPGFGSITGQGIGIAVLDTGVFAQNPDLKSNVVAFYNAVESPVSTPPQSPTAAIDDNGHGTHVSGIAASSNPAIGVADGAKLVDIRVIADPGESQLGGDPVLRGLEWVANNYQTYNIKVVNMSLGESGVNLDSVSSAQSQDAEAVAIQDLQKLGITVVSASGNSYANDPTPGASFPAIVSTISVANIWANSGQASDFGVPFGEQGDNYGAIDYSATSDTFASTSQRSTLGNQVAAPGEDIYSTWNGSSGTNTSDLLHNTLSGTSMASPFVSGMVALMQNAAFTFGGHYLSPTQCLQIIKQTSDTIVDSNNPNNARYNLLTGAITNLPETGLSFQRVNVLHAVEDVKAIMTGSSSGTGPQPGPDTDNTIADANFVPTLDGTRSFTFAGNIGADGQVLVGATDVDLYKIDVESPGQITIALALPSGGIAFNPVIRLLDASGNAVSGVAPVTGSTSNYPMLTTDPANPLPIGTYYLGVSAAGNSTYHIADGSGAVAGNSQGDYTITFSLLNPDPNGVIQGATAKDMTVPNNIDTDPFTHLQVTDILDNGLLGSDPPPIGSTTRITVSDDVDMFKVVAPDTGQLHVWTDTSAYINAADTYMIIFDANGNQVATNDDDNGFTGGNLTDSALNVNMTIGQVYYIAITVPANSGLSPTNPYTGRTAGSTPSDEAYDLHIAFNNGDTNGTAITAITAPIGTPVTGTIGADNGVALLGSNGGFKDVDFLSYTAQSSGLFDIAATSQTNGFTPVLSLWEFTAGQTNIIKIADTSGAATPELITQVFSGQNFFVAVTGVGNNNFNWFAVASGTGGQVGNYSLASRLRPLSDLPTLTDNTIGSGAIQTINVNGPTLKGNISMDGSVYLGATDVDLYKLTPTATQTLDIRTFTNQEGDADTFLRVFDASGNQLAANDNIDNTTTASAVRLRVEAGQTYYIAVSGANPAAAQYDPVTGSGTSSGSTGNYSLSVAVAVNSFTVSTPPEIIEPFQTPDQIIFTIAIDDPLTQTVSVDYATVDGTAVAGTDYTAVSGTITFAPGQTSQTVAVEILPNAGTSAAKTFTLDLSNSQGAPIAIGQGVATIQDVSYTQVAFGGGKVASYRDNNGQRISLSLVGAGSGQAVFIGTSREPTQINVTGAANSILNIKGSRTMIGDIIVNGSLSALNAKGVNVSGNVDITGPAGKISLGNVGSTSTQQTLTLGGGNTSVTLGHVVDLVLTTPGALTLLSVLGWNQSGALESSVSATSIGSLKSSGSFDANITSGGLGSAKISGALAGGTWTVSGGAGTLSATGAAAAGWSATFTGSIGVLQLGSDSGSISAASIRVAKIKGGMSSATLILIGAQGTDLGSLTVGGTVSSSQIRAAGSIGTVTAGSLSGSLLFAGVIGSVTALPDATSDFISPASISRLTVRGSFAASDVAANSLGKIVIHSIASGNGGTPFGLATRSLSSIQSPPDKWTSRLSPTLLKTDGDFIVRLLS